MRKVIEKEVLGGEKRASAQSIRCLNWGSWTQFSRATGSKKGVFLTAVVLEPLWAESGIFEDQGKAIAERDFGWLPSGTLGILSGIIPYGLPFLVEPVQVRLVVVSFSLSNRHYVVGF